MLLSCPLLHDSFNWQCQYLGHLTYESRSSTECKYFQPLFSGPNGSVYIHLASTENWMVFPISDPANHLDGKSPDEAVRILNASLLPI